MLIIEAGETCPHKDNCKFNDPVGTCFGSKSGRANKFTCEYATLTEVSNDNHVRNPLDQTGQMKIIME